MLFLEVEENENEKETESGKNKEKRAKKPKKKDKVKDPEDPQKTKKTTKKDRKRNLHLQQTNVPTTAVYTFTHTKASLVIAEKNLEVSIHQTESVSEMKSLEKDECEDSGQEDEDKSKSPPTQSPQRKRQLDICEP